MSGRAGHANLFAIASAVCASSSQTIVASTHLLHTTAIDKHVPGITPDAGRISILGTFWTRCGGAIGTNTLLLLTCIGRSHEKAIMTAGADKGFVGRAICASGRRATIAGTKIVCAGPTLNECLPGFATGANISVLASTSTASRSSATTTALADIRNALVVD
jgi:hypothetical protein